LLLAIKIHHKSIFGEHLTF